MSLITRMLNDLDKRQATSGEDQPIFTDVRLPSRSRWGGYGPMLLLVLGAIAIGILVLLWKQAQKHPTRAAPAPMESLSPLGAATPKLVITADNTPADPVQPVLFQSPAAKPAPMPAAPAAPQISVTVTQTTPDVSPVASPKLAAAPADAPADRVATKPAAAPVTQATKPQAAPPPTPVATEPKKKTKTAPVEIFPGIAKEAKPTARPLDGQPPSFKVVSPKQRSENSYRQAISLLQQARTAEAQQSLRQALGANSANHEARLMLAGLLTDTNNRAEAMSLLRFGLETSPGNSAFSMAMAQLQLADGARDEALVTLEKGLSAAADDAEYHAFMAALLQKQGQHAKAIQHYLTALRSNPAMPSWLIGAGISLQADNKLSDASEAFQRALDTGELSPEVARFAAQRVEQLRHRR